jgi:hypothetical protein
MGTTYRGCAFRNAMKGGEHGKARRQGRSGDGRGIGDRRKIGQLQVEYDFLAGQPAISRVLRGGR